MSEHRSAVAELISTVKQHRDEIKLKLHLGSREVKDRWDELDDRFARLKAEYEPLAAAVDETAEDVGESLKLIAEELKDGFNRIRETL